MKRKSNRVGRPSKEESARLSRHIHFRLTEDEYSELERKCKESQLSMGSLVVKAVKSSSITKATGILKLEEIDRMSLSDFLRVVVHKAEVVKPIPDAEITMLTEMYKDLRDIHQDARTIARKGAGEHYYVVYSESLKRLQMKTKEYMTKYLKQVTE